MHCAALLWDILQFYEHIGHERLLEQSILSKFPLSVLRSTLPASKWKRVLLLNGAVAAPLLAAQGRCGWGHVGHARGQVFHAPDHRGPQWGPSHKSGAPCR
eukprot:5464804-Pyramimonas_sp.AAC.1